MGMDEKSNISIAINGENSGQINLGQGSSTINAVINKNNTDIEGIKDLTISLLDLLKNENEGISVNEKEEIKEVIETINQEVTSAKPKIGILKLCLSKIAGLKDFVSETRFFEVVNGLTEKIQSFINNNG
jgi:hypothetical protein